MKFNFTKDWFNWAPEVWGHLIPLLPAQKDFLEIGSYEGRSAVWIAEHMMGDGGELICVDTWQGGEEHQDEGMGGVEGRFDYNVATLHAEYPDRRIVKRKGNSHKILAGLQHNDCTFDFIYIDGSHVAKDVMTDACMAWPLLKVGGIMVFDDYLWANNNDPRDILHRPKMAVDNFINLFSEELAMVHLGYQAAIKRVR